MKFKVAIRTKPILQDGSTNVKIRITHQHKTRYLATKYYILPKYFDKFNGLIKPGGKYTIEKAEKANSKLQIQVGELASKAEKHNLDDLDVKAVLEILKDKHTIIDFFAVIDMRINKCKRDSNLNYAGSFITTKNLLKNFYGPALQFLKIDYNFLVRLENDLKYKYKVSSNTLGIYMRNIRTIWNEGRKMGLVELSRNPFLNYKIPSGEPRKNTVLTPVEMATLAKIEIKEPLMRWSRDMAILSFLLIGINPKDMFTIKEIAGGRVIYKRSKGGRNYSIKIPPQAIHIIKRYPGKKYLLDTMDRYANYRYATKRIDKKLKDIARLCGIDKEIIIYTFRHCWSAYARYLGVSKDDISAALGHKEIDLPAVTEFYDHIEEEQRRVDEANKKVRRLILRTPAKLPLSV